MKTEELVEKTVAIIEAMCSEEMAESLWGLIASIGEDKYFTAPASSKEEYHNCFPGGLAEHNLNVLSHLVAISKQLNSTYTDEELCIVALLHDIGKAENSDGDDFYGPQTESWRAEKLGEVYQHNFGSVYFPTNQRTMFILQKHGFKLSPTCYQAILLNDGMGVEGNKVYNFRQTDLSVMLHSADHLATIQEKKLNKPSENK